MLVSRRRMGSNAHRSADRRDDRETAAPPPFGVSHEALFEVLLALLQRGEIAAMSEQPKTRYTRSADGLYIAYQAIGDGPMDVVIMPMNWSNVELHWEEPIASRFFRHLGSLGRRSGPRRTRSRTGPGR